MPKGAGNVTTTYNSHEITDYVNQAQIAAAIDSLESTDMGSAAKEYEPGLASWTASIDVVKWDATIDGYLAPDAVTPGTKKTFVHAVSDGTNTVTYTWTSNAFPTGYSIQSAPGALINSPGVAIQLSGAPSRAVT
jgi:hypothetical protein